MTVYSNQYIQGLMAVSMAKRVPAGPKVVLSLKFPSQEVSCHLTVANDMIILVDH